MNDCNHKNIRIGLEISECTDCNETFMTPEIAYEWGKMKTQLEKLKAIAETKIVNFGPIQFMDLNSRYQNLLGVHLD